MPVIAYTPFGREAIVTLARAIEAAKAGEALAPVTVAAPNVLSGLHLRRSIPEVMGAFDRGRCGLVNVLFMPLARIAELLGAPNLSGKGWRPVSDTLSAEILRGCVRQRPGVFAPVRDHPSTVESLLGVFPHLRHAPSEALDTLSQASERSASVVALFRAYRSRLSELRLYDDTDVAEAAREVVGTGGAALSDIGHVIVHLPEGLAASDIRLLQALNERGTLSVVLGLSGEKEADEETLRLGVELGAGAPKTETAPAPPPSLLVSVQDADEEIREVIRQVMERARAGVPLYRMALLWRRPEPYARAALEELSASGIPCNGRSMRRLSESFAGRTLLGALRLGSDGWTRHGVMDWLTGAPVHDEEKRQIQGPAWERVARAAGVVRGEQAWNERLQAYVHLMSSRADRSREDDESPENARRQAEHAEDLLAFVQGLLQHLSFSEQATWRQWADLSREVLSTYLNVSEDATEWTPSEINSLEDVRKALDRLSNLDEVSHAPLTLESFTTALERELSHSAGLSGKLGQGLFIGSLAEAAGMDFDCVFVVGMTEGCIPTLSRDNPLIPEHERRDGDGLDRMGTGLAEERRTYAAAVRSGGSYVLLFPRADHRAGRENLPSRWFLDAASALSGRIVSSGDLPDLRSEPWFKSIPSFESALLNEPPASPQEYDLGSILRSVRRGERCLDHFIVKEHSLSSNFECEQDRASSGFTVWDGRLSDVTNFPSPSERVLSPTALERYAACPFQFFLQDVLDIEETLAPEETPGLDPLVRGTLYHEALRTFFEEHLGRSPDQGWSDSDKERMEGIAGKLLDELERDGVARKSLLWDWTREQVISDLTRTLDTDATYRSKQQMVPYAFESAFGGAEGVAVDADGCILRIRGRIDRVDRHEDGVCFWVIDYKSGSSHDKKGECLDFEQGRLMQVALYTEALRRTEGKPAGGQYWYLRDKKKVGLVTLSMTSEMRALLLSILRVIGSGMSSGIFVANPGEPDREGYENCRRCRYDRVCPANRARLWHRKSADPFLAGYATLAANPFEITAPAENEGDPSA